MPLPKQPALPWAKSVMTRTLLEGPATTSKPPEELGLLPQVLDSLYSYESGLCGALTLASSRRPAPTLSTSC